MSQGALEAALRRLSGLGRLGVRPGLERLGAVLARLGDPQHRFPSIHIAGTNGKGSTAAFLAACLRADGYRTALYTSPHLCRFGERIQVDGREIPADAVEAGLDRLLAAEPGLTFFEAATGIAFLHFAEQQVDAAVVETGLGGGLDATNLVRPMASVLTRIDLDHLEIIGPDLEAIAREKAGIIKAGAPAISAPASPIVAQALARRCEAVGSPLLLGGRDFRWRRDPGGLTVEGPGRLCSGLSLSLAGEHQLENAALAVVALCEISLPVSGEAIRRGLAEARWPGRLERVGSILLDGAHNANGARALAAYLAGQGQRWTVIMGLLGPKDPREIVGALAPYADRFLFTRPRSPRAVDPGALLACAASVTAEVCPDLRGALARAGQGPVLVTGSLYLVGEARALLLGEQVDPLAASDPLGVTR